MFGTGIAAGINFDMYDKVEVSVTGDNTDTLKPLKTFANSGLSEFLLNNVKKSGYSKPTPIQKFAIPFILAKRDLMGEYFFFKHDDLLIHLSFSLRSNRFGQNSCIHVADSRHYHER